MTATAKANNDMPLIRAQPGPQEQFLATSADVAFYGGAAGGGKSFALLMDPLYDIGNPKFGAVIFRRTTKQITNEGALWDTSADIYPHLGAKSNQQALSYNFPSRASVTFAHMEHEKNRHDWQGSQIPCIGFDELTHFTWKQFSYMLSRNRSTSGVKGRIRGTCNPDPDHWVRAFIDWYIGEDGYAIPERSGVIRWFVVIEDVTRWGDAREELVERFGPDCKPKSFTFISSSIYDNPALLEVDPGYLANLQALPRIEQERLLRGNWDIRPAAGSYFQRADFEIVDAAPPAKKKARAWDLAATKKKKESDDPDYTAGVRISEGVDGYYYIEHALRFQCDARDVIRRSKNTADQDGKDVRQRFPQDPGQAGKAQADYIVRKFAGHNVTTKPVTGSKETRATPLSSQVQAGNVRLVRGPWNEEFLVELENFPLGAHDDYVDAASDAFEELAGNRKQAGAF